MSSPAITVPEQIAAQRASAMSPETELLRSLEDFALTHSDLRKSKTCCYANSYSSLTAINLTG